MQIGIPERQTHDYVRHGTTTLFAALDIATGQVTGICKPRHRHQEFLVFLKHVAHAYPGEELHLVMDNYSTPEKQEVRDWLADNPRITVHYLAAGVGAFVGRHREMLVGKRQQP
ncbi:transposase [Rhodococcus sp. 1168]|uniref:transposase n=1 Tax=Rhodococcus sp. 1168 TaxID=2018041 RepID=UPI000A0C0816|nr:transposase [Rhodococcus sp. 1168]ORI19275.1 hypothetical protein BJI47_12440 [Rhodococcus sp. 1168]